MNFSEEMKKLLNFVRKKEAELMSETWSQSHAGGCSSSNTRADLNVRLPPTPSPESKYDKVLLSNDSGSSHRGNLNQPLRYVSQSQQNTRNYCQPYPRQPYINGNNVCRYPNPLTKISPNQNREFALPGVANAPIVNSSACCHNSVLPPSPESPLNGNLISSIHPTPTIIRNDNPRSTYAYQGQNNILPYQSSNTTFTTSPTSTNARGIVLPTRVTINPVPGTNDWHPVQRYNESQRPLNYKNNINAEFRGARPRERVRESLPSSQLPSSARSNTNVPVLSSLLSGGPTYNNVVGTNNVNNNNVCLRRHTSSYTSSAAAEQQVQDLLKQQKSRGRSPVVRGLRLNSTGFVLDTDTTVEEEIARASEEVDTLVARNYSNDFSRQLPPCSGGSASGGPLAKNIVVPHCSNAIAPTLNIVEEMKYETQSGPPTAPPHLTSSGVEPPHSSQGSGIVVGGSPTEVVGVDSLLLSSWAANGSEFLEGGVPDAKQTAAGYQDWDSLILGSTAPSPSLVEMKPLPPFTNYTANLQINGISGHHYHAIASSGQRSSIPSASPTPSSNQEYYESSVVSSSTPCPQTSQKQQQQQQQQQQNHQQQQHHHHHHNQHQQQPQQQQQLPQSTQQMDYEDIDDIAEIIGSAIADTTVPGNGNGPSSEQDPEASRDWIDIADWINTDCSPKTQETTSPSSFASQIYVTTTPSAQTQSHAGSTLQSLLTQTYAPMLQARLQAGTVTGIQNASCGETPSSTSPYPPLSPPNRVSTSCSPDEILHSSFPAPSHPRKRSRSSPASGQNPAKKGPTAGAAALQYGTESGLIGGKEKTVHRCTICNRGFLNKSNIKVHLRTHTGEKPFKCDVCHKAFRQKAHLIKHQQIHKRIGRD